VLRLACSQDLTNDRAVITGKLPILKAMDVSLVTTFNGHSKIFHANVKFLKSSTARKVTVFHFCAQAPTPSVQ
jgi:hypothetical protein